MRKKPGDGFTRGADHLPDFFMRKGESGSQMAVALRGRGGQVEQKASQLFRGGAREPQVANFKEGRVIDLAENFRNTYCRFSMFAQEMQKCFSRNEVGLKRFESFGGQFIRFAGKCPGEPDNLTRFRDADNNRLSIGRIRRELHSATAENEHSAWLLSFDKQDSFLRVGCG